MSVFGGRIAPPRAPLALPLPDQFWFSARSVAQATAAVTAERLIAAPFLATETCRIDQVAVRVSTGAAGNCKLGIYAALSRAEQYLPGALLGEITADLSTASAAVLIGTLAAPVTVRRGALYWVAAVFSGTPTILAYPTNIASGGGAAWPIGSPATLSGLSLNANFGVSRAERTDALAYVAAAPFLPAAFGAATHAGGLPGGPLYLLRKAA